MIIPDKRENHSLFIEKKVGMGSQREELEPEATVGDDACASLAGGDSSAWAPCADGLAAWQWHKADLGAGS